MTPALRDSWGAWASALVCLQCAMAGLQCAMACPQCAMACPVMIVAANDDVCRCGAQTLSDNLLLYSYQQWESKEDFYDYIKSDTVQPLAEYIKENVRRSAANARISAL